MAVGEKRKSPGGRKKIEIKRIESKPARDTCFTKRRQGLFKKAAELACLTGAQIVIVAFSPGGRPFCFGHPSVDDLINRYLDHPSHHPNAAAAGDSTKIEALANELVELDAALDQVLHVENMGGLEVLETVKKALEELKAAWLGRRDQKVGVHEGDHRAPVGNQFLAMMGDLHAVIAPRS